MNPIKGQKTMYLLLIIKVFFCFFGDAIFFFNNQCLVCFLWHTEDISKKVGTERNSIVIRFRFMIVLPTHGNVLGVALPI